MLDRVQPAPVAVTTPPRRDGRVWRTAILVLLSIGLMVYWGIQGFRSTPSAELSQSWTVDPNAMTGGYGREFIGVDGSATGTVLSTAQGWVVMASDEDPSTSDALASLDPSAGETQWQVAIDAGRCTQREAGVDLLCVVTQDGSAAPTLLNLDPATGEPIDGSARVDLDLPGPPVLLAPFQDGLLALSEDATLTAFDLDGNLIWSDWLGIYDWYPDMDVITVGQYPQSLLITVNGQASTLVLPDGPLPASDCRTVVVADQAWLCDQHGEVYSYGPDGTELWRDHTQDIDLIGQYFGPGAVGVNDNGDGSVSFIDPATGRLGPPVELTDDHESLRLIGDARFPLIAGDTGLSLLSNDGSELLWRADVRDDLLDSAQVAVVNNVLIVGGSDLYGFDAATGEQLWKSGQARVRQMWAHDGALVGSTWEGLSRFQLP
ncbi:MAG: PQQ-binding-like beta-propeller repeat protein [Beutenbergiaceae bacterium]